MRTQQPEQSIDTIGYKHKRIKSYLKLEFVNFMGSVEFIQMDKLHTGENGVENKLLHGLNIPNGATFHVILWIIKCLFSPCCSSF